MPAWFEARACRKSIKIHSDAAALLDDVIGADLAALDEAMERFYLYAATSGVGTGRRRATGPGSGCAPILASRPSTQPFTLRFELVVRATVDRQVLGRVGPALRPRHPVVELD